MPVNQITIATTPTQICEENPRRVTLLIKNCTGIGVPTGLYFRLADNKGDVTVNRGYLIEPKEIIILRKIYGDHPEKAWWGQSAAGNSCCTIIESISLKGEPPEIDVQEPRPKPDPVM